MQNNRRMSRKQRRQAEREVNQFVDRKFSMKNIKPITKTQEDLFDSYSNATALAAIGSAGTGKTMCALFLALKDVLEKQDYEHVIIIRSAVQSRDQGFMPGSQIEKASHFETPYIDIVNDLFGRGDAYQILKSKGSVKFMTTSFIRGLTFDNAVIIADEVQNFNFQELDTVMTRVGESSKIILCGDVKQDDLTNSKNRLDVSGLRDFLKITSKMRSFDIIEFTTDDIVRSGIVKEYLIAKELEAA